MIPQDLEIAFNKALENELGKSFRDAHYNLVGMSTGYKRTGGQLTATPAKKEFCIVDVLAYFQNDPWVSS